MDELVMFTRNLTPGMTNMTKQVDARQEDLTNPSHAAILGEESEQVCSTAAIQLFYVGQIKMVVKINGYHI